MNEPELDCLRCFDFEGVAVRGGIVRLGTALTDVLAQHF